MDQGPKLETWNTKIARRKYRQSLHDTDMEKDFMNKTSFAHKLRSTIDKWDFIKPKASAKLEKESTRWRGSP